MSERLSITPLGPYIGAQISGADLTRPLSDNQFEQLYHAVLRHQVVFLRDQAITPQQQRTAGTQRLGGTNANLLRAFH
ncbi:TauD/TfdA family dioxygenase, partial [Escherichia sp. TWPC-MK]